MKRNLSVLLSILVLLSAFSFTAVADEKITVMVNGEELISDVPAQTLPVYDENGEYIGGRVMLPIRAISEELNCDVYWNQATSGITIYRKNNLYIMWVGTETAFHMDGLSLSKGYEMDVPPTAINQRTLIPVRAVAELMGAEVKWINETGTVDIKYDLGEFEANTGYAERCVIYEEIFKQTYPIYEGYVNGTLDTVTGKIVLENGEEIKFELYPQLAPATCETFVSLAKAKFYENTIFHRVIKGFVVQGGGFDINNVYKPSATVEGEFLYNGYFNLIPHVRGTISLARADDNNSGSSQFFIVHKDSPHLNAYYAAFGKVTEGMEIVDKMCLTETDENDKPVTPIVVKEIIIDD